MDTSVTVVAVAVGASLALWVCTVAAGAYAIWTFVYKPWKAIRADMVALDTKVNQAVATLSQQRVLTLTDEEVAMRERQMRARQTARREAGVGS
jgi:hypothetical protein